MDSALTQEQLKKYRSCFYEDQKNVLAQNVCSRMDPYEVCLSRKDFEDTHHVFNHKIENEGKPVTNQKNSGRCWIFAALNVMRVPFMKSLNIDDFEFSQNYLFFWDKLERSNYFLNNIAQTSKRGETVDGRLISFLLQDPTMDGGQWDMFINLVIKYGVMPKKCFPESFPSELSSRLNGILKSKLREYAKAIRDMIASGGSDGDVKELIEEQMGHVYRIVAICLGIPDDTFTWSYYDKNKAFQSIGPITPNEFYENHVKPIVNVMDKVCVVTDPRPCNQYERLYTVDCLGNMVNGRSCNYNNQPVELLLEMTAKSIINGEPVWFGCEVGKRHASKYGLLDLNIQNFELVFGTNIQTSLSKSDRLVYGDSAMTHAMIFTAVSTNEAGEVTKLRVENSWGEDRGEKGYLLMTADWFREFVFEVAIDKKYVPESVLEVFKQEPIRLPAWDPMGALAF